MRSHNAKSPCIVQHDAEAIRQLLELHTAESLEADLRDMYRHLFNTTEPMTPEYMQDKLFTLDHLCCALRKWMD